MTGRIVLLVLIAGLSSCSEPKKDDTATRQHEAESKAVIAKEQEITSRLDRIIDRWRTAPAEVKLKLSEPDSQFQKGLGRMESETDLKKREAIVAELEKALDAAER